jgi:aspartyl/glutamyl-tRNA(Asn/Gln) amidotransferase C subunit
MKPKINVDYISTLAHLRLTEEEKADFAPKLIKVIEWVGKLEELKFDDSGIEGFHSVPFSLPFRQDEIRDSFPTELALANSPEKKKDFILVPKVIEEK